MDNDVIAGDRVLLNANARPAFAHQVLHVDEVRSWGLCGHTHSAHGIVHYRAEWNEVDRIISDVLTQPLKGML